jgi:nicotinate (nicotinamide) nucleotide adenylyltransferase
MTRLAVRGNPGFTVSTLETRRRGASYTVDTLRALHDELGDGDLYLLIGEDSLREFHTWHEPEAIRSLATLVVAPRPGEARSRSHTGRRARRDRRSRRARSGRARAPDGRSVTSCRMRSSVTSRAVVSTRAGAEMTTA